jgi:hypothetical protein
VKRSRLTRLDEKAEARRKRWVKFSAYEKQTKTTPSVVLTSSAFAPLRRDKPATIVPGGFTLVLDLGDRSHHVCVLDAAGHGQGVRPDYLQDAAGGID